MQRITGSVEIRLPKEKVFAFLRTVEDRLRLNPFSRLLSFEKLTEGEIGVGTRFRITLVSSDRRADYESEVLEFVENEKIVTRDRGGKLRLTLTLKDTPGGTLLTHDEEFVIPPDVLAPAEEVQGAPYWMRLLRHVFVMEQATFTDREAEKRIAAITKSLSDNLRVWLSVLKERMEAPREDQPQA